MTSDWEKFKLLMWKNWVLQKRHKIRTLIEIFSPVVFVSILVFIRSKVDPKLSPPIEFPKFKASYFPHLHMYRVPDKDPFHIILSYSPKNDMIDRLIKNSMIYLVNENLVPFIINKTLNSKETLCMTGTSLADVAKCLSNEIFIIKGYENATILEYALFNPLNKDRSYCGIQFPDSMRDLKAWPNDTTLTLRFPAQLRNVLVPDSFVNWATDLLYPIVQMPGPREPTEEFGGLPSYLKEGFTAIAHSVIHEIIKMKSKSKVQPEIWMKRLPHPEYLDDSLLPVLERFIPLIIILSFHYTCINTTRAITVEKEKRLKEFMKIMGVSNWLHWTAWFVKTFSYMTIANIFITFLFKFKWYNTDDGVTGYSIFSFTPWHVIFVFLNIYTITSIFFCFMISTFFSKANTAAKIIGLLWVVVYVPYEFLYSDKAIASIGSRITTCFASNAAMAYGFQIISRNEATAQGLLWGNMFKALTKDDPLVMGHVILMLILDGALYLLIALYVEQVWPGSCGVPQPWYFPISKIRFNPIESDEKYKINDIFSTSNTLNIEEDPIGLKVGIAINNLTKIFKNKISVCRLNFKIFENQITALLGHNGAGKTTLMSMLTGMIPPTSGTAILAGEDLLNTAKNARICLGICPQYNVLFSDLTVSEHLYFYSSLKGMSGNLLNSEIDKYIHLMDLEDKRNAISSILSGGMQRRLSVGTALCGRSKVVLLDEPSSGMDPSGRRKLWKLLQSEKIGRTILLTTHFMDEAELLGERVAIMSEGRLQCLGSPFYLKKIYGIGYRLTVTHQTMANIPSTISLINNVLKKYIPDVEKNCNAVGSEISYILPKDNTYRFKPMLEELEEKYDELKLTGLGISAPTLEDVFMRLVPKVNEAYNNIKKDVRKNDDCESKYEQYYQLSKRYKFYFPYMRNTGMKYFLNQIQAMFFKRWLILNRTWLFFVIQILLPVVFLSIAIFVTRMGVVPTELPAKSMELSELYPDSVTYLSHDAALPNDYLLMVDEYKDYFNGTNIDSMVLQDIGEKNLSTYYLNRAAIDLPSMRTKNLIGATFSSDKITAWFSNFGFHDAPISLVLAQRAIQNILTPGCSITIINHPLPFSLISTFQLLSYGDWGGFQISFLLGMSMTFISAYFILFYVKENKSGSKLLQLTTGLSPAILWNTAFVWDFLLFMIISLSVCITLGIFQESGLATFVEICRVFMVFVAFSWAMLPIQYFFSSIFSSPSQAFSNMCLIHFFTGIAPFILLEVLQLPQLKLKDVGSNLHKIFLIFPHYTLTGAIKNLHAASVTLQTCLDFCDVLKLDTCDQYIVCNITYMTTCCLPDDPYLEWDGLGIGAHLTYMAVVGLICYLMLFIKEYKIYENIISRIKKQPPPITSDYEDSDVANERSQISTLLHKDYSAYNLLSKDLSKYYGKHLAVDKLSIGVKDGECFGLLGVNGAGKTSTFKMLTGDSKISYGNAWIKGYSVKSDIKSVHKNIGYCPQFDAIFDELTGREMLQMYSLLRGIPYQHRLYEILNISIKLGLYEYIYVQARKYSGGNKRKLNAAIALLGDPQVLYLDEPTTGMDPKSKRSFWRAISKCRCVVLTSHSMEECEALCSRIGIMVNGKLKCLGSLQQLKNKFSQGYTLIAKIQRRKRFYKNEMQMHFGEVNMSYTQNHKLEDQLLECDFKDFDEFVKYNFPSAELKEFYQGLVTYHLRDKNIKWSTIFGIMELGKREHNIEDYSIGQTSLEQIFLELTND